MKKVLLLLVGLISISIYVNNQVEAKESEKADETIQTQEYDGEASDESIQQNIPRKFAKTMGNRPIELKRFYIDVTDGATYSVSVNMPNTDFSISYSHEGTEIQLYDGKQMN